MNYDIVLCQSEVDDLFEHPILIEMTQDNLKLTLPQNKLNLQIWLIFALFDYLNFLLKETLSPYDKCWSYIFGELQDIADLICNHRGSFSNSNRTARYFFKNEPIWRELQKTPRRRYGFIKNREEYIKNSCCWGWRNRHQCN